MHLPLLSLLISTAFILPVVCRIHLEQFHASDRNGATVIHDERTDAPSPAFDCGMRQLALRYAHQLQPFRSARHFQQIADALNGSPRAQENGCNITIPSYLKDSKLDEAPSFAALQNTTTIFVDSSAGNDAHSGTEDMPLKTLAHAVDVSRASPRRPVVIFLRAGTFYLKDTIQLDERDSELVIQNFQNEEVWLSGGAPISPAWKEYNVTPGPTWIVEENQNAFYGRHPNEYIHINGTYSAWPECEQACQKNITCQVWTWISPSYKGFRNECWFNEQRVWSPTPEEGIVSGYKQPGKNIYMADLSSSGVESVPGLRIDGRRAIRARYPNADPELGFGSELRPKEWLKPTTPRHADKIIAAPTPFRNTSDSFQLYSIGIGGACNMYSPPSSYWCGPDNITRGFGVYMPRSPSGFLAGQDLLPNSPYADTSGAIVHAFAFGNHWFSWSFEVDHYNSTAGEFLFGQGGHQGPQGTDNGEQMYVENIFEELDSPNEWFFNESTKTLYLWYNGTGMPPSETEFVAVQNKVLINVTASQEKPIKGLQIRGVNFRDTAYAYLDPRAVPSDDWTLQYSAALILQGTENATVDSCIFERVDGNAILILGYNRYATVQKSEFAWIGDTAIASWGFTQGVAELPGVGWDGTDGNHPRHNQIIANIGREIGIWQKQSSFYFQAKSCLNNIQNNIAYNGPRAGVNFNDGFGGGSNLTDNIIFNMCRESGDHGPFNSWDKQVYVVDLYNTGKGSVVKAYDTVARNFMIANYNSQEAIDNDDGSCYYDTHHNFFAYSGNGMKNDFGGHDNHHHNNIYAYIGIGFHINKQLPGHEDFFYNNTLVLLKDGAYGAGQECLTPGQTVVHDNSLYTPNGSVTECGMTLADWQAKGFDPGTTASTYPDDSVLLSAITKLLKIA